MRRELRAEGRPHPPGQPDVVVVAASGTSGAGKAAKPHLLGSEIMGNASAYGVGWFFRCVGAAIGVVVFVLTIFTLVAPIAEAAAEAQAQVRWLR